MSHVGQASFCRRISLLDPLFMLRVAQASFLPLDFPDRSSLYVTCRSSLLLPWDFPDRSSLYVMYKSICFLFSVLTNWASSCWPGGFSPERSHPFFIPAKLENWHKNWIQFDKWLFRYLLYVFFFTETLLVWSIIISNTKIVLLTIV